MKFFSFYLMFLLTATLLSSCATHSKSSWQIKTGDRTTLAFSGKGAAAGMMMDAYMGGAGIAIGIAIDEGIAKDIATDIKKYSPDFNIVSMVESQLSKQSFYVHFFKRNNVSTQVVIEAYGFHTFPSEGDKASAWLKMHFISNGKDVFINYPADFSSPTLAELNDIKTNPKLAYGLLNNAVAEVLLRQKEIFK